VNRDSRVEASEQILMPHVRRRRHEMLSVDELVPFPIVREQQEVVVGETMRLRAGRHGVTPVMCGSSSFVISWLHFGSDIA
jgi:hypothetical protein